jgi:hypothetical protein
MFAYNGKFESFREIALSYNLPSNWVRKAGLGSFMLSVTGQNLGYLTEANIILSGKDRQQWWIPIAPHCHSRRKRFFLNL